MNEIQSSSRRHFLKSAAFTGVGLTILPSGILRGAQAPSNKLNIGLIGAWGRAAQHSSFLKTQNIGAVCDVSEKHLGIGLKGLGNPKAATYKDWRVMLDKQKDLDAVFVCSPDHTHAHIATWALNRGLHIYLEKPIGNCVEECRTVRDKWLSTGKKVATQVGTQRHAYNNFPRVAELIKDGAIGDLKTTCDFDYSGRMMEMMMLGLAAYRAGVAEKVDYDPEKGLTNNDAVNRHLSKTYREGWPIDA